MDAMVKNERYIPFGFARAQDDATKVLRTSLTEYFARAIPSKEYISWVAECEGRIIATSGRVVWQKPAIYGGVESGGPDGNCSSEG